jgi:hypothetical protein
MVIMQSRLLRDLAASPAADGQTAIYFSDFSQTAPERSERIEPAVTASRKYALKRQGAESLGLRPPPYRLAQNLGTQLATHSAPD